MEPAERSFVTLGEFVEAMVKFPSTFWMFRGQTDVSWKLQPKAGRPKFCLKTDGCCSAQGQPSSDLLRFDEWRKAAVAYCDHLPGNDFECLAFAQHYGLATRLLDWTSNPLVALFFAVEDEGGADGAVYCYCAGRSIDVEASKLGQIEQVASYSPRPFDRRILAQGGRFTYHPAPTEPLQAADMDDEKLAQLAGTKVNLVVFRVAGNLKRFHKFLLTNVGIDRRTLFPDLEGLSEFVNWQTRLSATHADDK